jgi:hypothetical protein
LGRWLAFAHGGRWAEDAPRAWPLLRGQVTSATPMAALSSGQSEAQMTRPLKHQLNLRSRLCITAGFEKNYKYH